MRIFSKAWCPAFASRTLKLLLPAGLLLSFGAASFAQIAPSALKEMAEVSAFKASLTPAEKKMSTGLILASRAAAGKPLGIMARFYNAPQRDSAGRIKVEVLGYASPSLLGSFAADETAGKPAATYQHSHLRGAVSANRLAELAAHSDVTSLREVTGHIHNVGSVTSQGVVSTGANKVVAGGTTGAGVKVGVISDSASASRVAALIASGDLPANTVVLPGQADRPAPRAVQMKARP